MNVFVVYDSKTFDIIGVFDSLDLAKCCVIDHPDSTIRNFTLNQDFYFQILLETEGVGNA